MTKRQTYSAFRALLEKQSQSLADAFDKAVQDLRSAAQISSLEDAIAYANQTGDFSRVWVVLHLDQNFWAPLDRAIRQAYLEGALDQINLLPKRLPDGGHGFVVRFDGNNPRAVQAAQSQAADLVTRIDADMRVMVQNLITDGAKESTPPRVLAKRLIGNKVGGKRVGGMIGLASTQEQYVANARAELADPSLMSNYFTRTRRDKRFDPTVRAAMEAGKSLSQDQINRITANYADRLLQLRGDTIGRTEALRALNAGKHEAIMQVVDSGQAPETAVKKAWIGDPRPTHRDGHWLLTGTEVGLHEKFTNPLTGEQMAYPGDPDAPASETVFCACSMRSQIDYVEVAKARGAF